MPYAAQPNYYDPNKQNNNQSGVNISGNAGADFSTGIPGQESTGSKDQKSSGNYANIQSYLSANKDQGDQMGQKIATDVGNKAQDATQKINDFSSKAPNVAAYDPNEAYNNVTNLSTEQKSNYQNEKATGGYSGPQTADGVDGYADTQKAATDASSAVKNAGNEYGQQQLLKDAYNRPQYSAGENRLDQALLQNSDGSKQALEGVTSKYKDLDNLFNTTATNVGTSINNANTQALANKNAIAAGEANQWKSLVDPIQARADQANATNGALIDRYTNEAANDKFSEDTLKALGLKEGQNIYNLNLASYLTPDKSQVGINNAATSDERAKYSALNDLFQDPTRNQITADGTAINPVTFNQDQFNKDLAGKSAEYEKYKNDYRGGFYDWAQKNNKYMTDNAGNSMGAPTGGSFFDAANNLSLNESAPYLASLAQASSPDVFTKYMQTAAPEYFKYLQDQMGANRQITKG